MMTLIMWVQHNFIVVVFTVFLLILITTYWPGRRSQLERHGRIPLDDDAEEPRSAHQD
jgi:cbb3-type cytochrome oxidase subunit 3